MKSTQFTFATIALSSLAALYIPTTAEAAGVFSLEGKSKCKIEGFKIDPVPVQGCCNENRGISTIDAKVVYCHVDLDKEGPFRKCVQHIGQATI
ncbi:hypothetical protein DFQ26_007729, partial [Actinomortierella ambigua]